MKDTKTEPKEPAQEPAKAKPEITFHCVVLKQPDNSLVKFGAMLCGAGAKVTLPQSQAEAAEKRGWIKIVGQA